MRTYLDDLYGNGSLRARLGAALETDSLSHAYIIEGPRGSGRHTLALDLAAALSCERRSDKTSPLPCRVCRTCQRVLRRMTPDVQFHHKEEDKTTFGVTPIRKMRDDIYLSATELDHKVYIVEDADLLTAEAQNALLIVLEEPPKNVHTFLLVERAESLLPTIRSRAQTLRMERLDRETLKKALSDNPEAQRLARTSSENFDDVLSACDGWLGMALELLTPTSEKTLFKEKSAAGSLVRAMVRGTSPAAVFAAVDTLPQKKPDLLPILALCQGAVRDLILLKKDDRAHLLFWSNRSHAEEISEQSDLRRLLRVYDALTAAQESLLKNANVHLTLTILATTV